MRVEAPCQHHGYASSIRDPIRLYTGLRFFHGLVYSLFAVLFLPYQTDVVKLEPYQLLLMGTALEVTVFLFEVPTGIVADLYSRRLSVSVGLVLNGVAVTMMALMPRLWPFLAAQVVWGIGETFISGARDAWVADEIPHGPRPAIPATRAFLASEQGWMLGSVVGMWGGTFLATRALSLPFLVSGLSFVVLGLATRFVLPERGFHRAQKEDRNTWSAMARLAKDGWRLARTKAIFGSVILMVFLLGMASEGVDRLWAKHLEDFGLPRLGPVPQVHWWAIIGTASTLLAVGITGYLRRKAVSMEASAMFRIVGSLTLALSIVVLVFAFSMGFWLALVAFLALRGIRRSMDPLITGWINHHADKSVRATMLSVQSQSHGIGEVVGGPTAALVAKLSTVSLALAASGLMLCPALVVIWRGNKANLLLERAEKEAALG